MRASMRKTPDACVEQHSWPRVQPCVNLWLLGYALDGRAPELQVRQVRRAKTFSSQASITLTAGSGFTFPSLSAKAAVALGNSSK